MRRITLIATLTVTLCLTAASAAFAHHVDAVASTASCTGVTAKFSGFKTSDGDVTWGIKVDNVPVANGVIPAFNGDKTYPVTYPNALTGPGAHTVVFLASWPTKGSNNGTFTKTVTGCPAATPPLPCPNEPSDSKCNCPPGEKGEPGKDGITTTVVIHEQVIVYRDLTCTSARVFRMTIAQRVAQADEFGENAGQRIVGAVLRYRTIISPRVRVNGKLVPKPGVQYREGTRTVLVGAVGTVSGPRVTRARVGADGRLRVSADYRGVVAPKGQVRRPRLHVKLANGHWLWMARGQRLCLGFDGNMQSPPDTAQNGKPAGADGDAARAAAAKAPKYRKAVI